MAKRRCINIDFYDSEMFCELPPSAKHLYTELILHSDDDGVIINPTTVLRICKVKRDVLERLVRHNLILRIDGIYIIRHWYVHNKIQPSRKVDSIYSEMLFKLRVNERKEYEVIDDKLLTDCRPNLTKPNLTEVNSSKENIKKDNLNEMNTNEMNQNKVSQEDTAGKDLNSFVENKPVTPSEEIDSEAVTRRCREVFERLGLEY